MVRRSSCTPIAFWILLRTSSFVTWSSIFWLFSHVLSLILISQSQDSGMVSRWQTMIVNKIQLGIIALSERLEFGPNIHLVSWVQGCRIEGWNQGPLARIGKTSLLSYAPWPLLYYIRHEEQKVGVKHNLL